MPADQETPQSIPSAGTILRWPLLIIGTLGALLAASGALFGSIRVTVATSALLALALGYVFNLGIGGIPAIRVGAPVRAVQKAAAVLACLGLFSGGSLLAFVIVPVVYVLAQLVPAYEILTPQFKPLLWVISLWWLVSVTSTTWHASRVFSPRLGRRRGVIAAVITTALTQVSWMLIGCVLGTLTFGRFLHR